MLMCNGVIVEMGALDGIKFSNSFYYEYALGWKALLIEALPSNYKRLVVNRPNASTVHTAMCAGESTEFVVGLK